MTAAPVRVKCIFPATSPPPVNPTGGDCSIYGAATEPQSGTFGQIRPKSDRIPDATRPGVDPQPTPKHTPVGRCLRPRATPIARHGRPPSPSARGAPWAMSRSSMTRAGRKPPAAVGPYRTVGTAILMSRSGLFSLETPGFVPRGVRPGGHGATGDSPAGDGDRTRLRLARRDGTAPVQAPAPPWIDKEQAHTLPARHRPHGTRRRRRRGGSAATRVQAAMWTHLSHIKPSPQPSRSHDLRTHGEGHAALKQGGGASMEKPWTLSPPAHPSTPCLALIYRASQAEGRGFDPRLPLQRPLIESGRSPAPPPPGDRPPPAFRAGRWGRRATHSPLAPRAYHP